MSQGMFGTHRSSISRRTLMQGAVFGLAMAGTGLLASCGSEHTGPVLRMACGEKGGTYIRFGNLLGDRLRSTGMLTGFTAITTQGSADNIQRIKNREAEVGISLLDSVVTEGHKLVSLGRVYQNYLQCIVSQSSGIVSAGELSNRRVSVGAPNSGTARTAKRALDALGLLSGENPVVMLELGLTDAVSQLAAGAIDALMWSGGIPLPELLRIAPNFKPELIDLTEAIPAMREAFGGVYHYTVIPAGTYSLSQPVPTIGVANLLVTTNELSADLARLVVSVLVKDAVRLIPEPSRGLQYLTPATLVDTEPIPLHPAASAMYVEIYG